MNQEFSTPMMKQYIQIKKKHPDCLVFFRLGDFYELFLEDAKIGSKILNITLTSRNKGKDGKIPMAGVPYHAADTYLAKLVKAGYKVAICEQTTEPDGKGIVEREVVRIVTPGTILDEKTLNKNENNYIASISLSSKLAGIAIADLSTGDFQATEFSFKENLAQILKDEISRINPAECILPNHLYNTPEILKIVSLQKKVNIYPFHDWDFFAQNPEEQLKKHFAVDTLLGFGLENKFQALKAAAALLGYLKHTQKNRIRHLRKIRLFSRDDYVSLDRSTIINLELFSTIREGEKKGSLIHLLDQTATCMGSRMLKQWLVKPLTDKQKIIRRHDAVDEFLKDRELRQHIRNELKEVSDIERILSRLSTGLANARDLVSLKLSLNKIILIKKLMEPERSSLIKTIYKNIDTKLEKLENIIEKTILDEPSVDIKQGGIIKEGINKELDSLRQKTGSGKKWIAELEKKEKERTGITSLKIRFNKVFGYYIEISKSNLHLVPSNYIRKQTLTNAERFITPELKEQEELVLTAEDKINELEYQIFRDIVSKILKHLSILQKTAENIAMLDCLLSFAHLAEKQNYCRPEIVTSGEIIIKEGKHPVVEKLLGNEQFVPNDVILNEEDHQLLLITGPNMAGKSVFIRQVALIVLLAQIGSFVSAKNAKISIVDRIFVRSGALDVITSGLSTFMVEMVETANILHNSSKNSLVILDEIGRGTSTYDGISIAWAVAEYLVSHPSIRPKTLFATHYHELQTLEESYHGIKNYQMAVDEKKGKPIFLHKVIPGGATHSYGLAVAKLAGVPKDVIYRAVEILRKLEDREVYSPSKKITITPQEQLTFLKDQNHPVIEALQAIDIDSLTPLEALKKLAELKKRLNY